MNGERLRAALRGRLAPVSQALRPHGCGGEAAAVLVPLCIEGGEVHVLYTRRTDHLAHHSGQIAFPGGRWEATDVDLLATALRETEEEVGIPREAVDVLGILPGIRTVSSNFHVTPFVGWFAGTDSLRTDPLEVAEAFLVPLAALFDPQVCAPGLWERDGHKVRIPTYRYGERVIWGVTQQITASLLAVIEDLAAGD